MSSTDTILGEAHKAVKVDTGGTKVDEPRQSPKVVGLLALSKMRVAQLMEADIGWSRGWRRHSGDQTTRSVKESGWEKVQIPFPQTWPTLGIRVHRLCALVEDAAKDMHVTLGEAEGRTTNLNQRRSVYVGFRPRGYPMTLSNAVLGGSGGRETNALGPGEAVGR